MESIPLIRREVAGASLILAPRAGGGIAAAQVLIRRGSADELPGEAGLASFTASMLRRGTTRLPSARVAVGLESIGAITQFSAGLDAMSGTVQSAAADFPEALELFWECLLDPAFDPREIEIERQSVLARLRRVEDEKFDFTYRAYIKQIFAGHGYGHPVEGEPADVGIITDDLCRSWHDRMVQPANMLIVAAGDFDPDAFAAQAGRRLTSGGGAPRSPARHELRAPPIAPSSSLVLEKELEQGFIVLGFRVPGAMHEDRPALRLACAALGEGFAGRLFKHLRDERSLAYAVGSSLQMHRLGGHMALYIGTEPARLGEAREGLLAEADRITGGDLSDADLGRARQYAIGKFLMDHQSIASRAGHLARWEDLGAGAEYDARYADDLRRVTTGEAIDAARRWWVNPTVVVLRPGR